ncbi:MAG TPA: hypothetical protein VKE69_07945 [Planctomycetota bacterium]|nr:hypothetical protein [Planctomycetota bacterium]
MAAARLALFSLVLLAPQSPDAFWGKFDAGLASNADEKELAAIVKKEDPETVTRAFIARVHSFAVSQDVALGEKIEKLVKAWEAGLRSKFLDVYYDDLRSLDAEGWRTRDQLIARWDKLFADDQKRKKGELDAAALTAFATEAVDLAKALEELGDRYFATYSWWWAGLALDPDKRKDKGGDADKALEHYRKSLAIREKMDLRDRFYFDLFGQVSTMEASKKKKTTSGPASGGKAGDPKGAAAPAPPMPPSELPDSAFAPGSAWVASATKFQPVGPADYERPSYTADENFLDWYRCYIKGDASAPRSTPIDGFPAKAAFVREGAKFFFDFGTKDRVALKLGRPFTFDFLMQVSGGVDYALTAALGSDRESMQGVTVGLLPSDMEAQLYYAPAASRQFDVGGTKVRVFDDNADGRYAIEPVVKQGFYLRFEGPFPAMDSMAVGTSKHAVPASSLVKVGPKWFRVSFGEGSAAKQARAREAAVKTGTVKIAWNGTAELKPTWIVVRQKDDPGGVYFDIAAGGDKGVEVPAGEYELVYGLYRSGKGKQVQKYVVLPASETAPKVAVEAGKVATMTFGGPFTFACKPTQDSNEVHILGRSVEIRGANQERYVLLSNHIPKPIVEVRKPGEKAGQKLGEMKRIENLAGKHTADDLWFPLDFAQKKSEPVSLEIRLVQEHEWFGSIASEWTK